jgi:hypothetical protein
MLKTFRQGSVFSYCSRMIFLIAGLLLSIQVFAAGGCSLKMSTGDSNAYNSPISMTQSMRMNLKGSTYYDTAGLPNGALLSHTAVTTIAGASCQSLNAGMTGKKMRVVYVAPPGATPYAGHAGAGYLIPTNVQGISLAIEFASASAGPEANSLALAMSTTNVLGPAGSLFGAGFPHFAMSFTLVKSGSFTRNQPEKILMNIPGQGGGVQVLQRNI